MSREVDENSKQPTWREKFSGLVLFAADWFKDWCDFSEPIREGNEVKTQYYQLISRAQGRFLVFTFRLVAVSTLLIHNRKVVFLRL